MFRLRQWLKYKYGQSVISKKIVLPIAVAVGAALGGLLAYQVFVVGSTEPGFVLQPDEPAITAHGKTIYMEQCASCHGTNLEGEPNWRVRKPSGRLPAPPHDETGHTWHHADQALIDLTKYGPQYVAGDSYQSDMPAFEDVLSDDEVVAVLSYIKSTWPPKVLETHNEINRRSVPQ